MNDPAVKEICDKFPAIPVILIQNYKEVFNRPKQNVHWQKSHPALILGKKEKSFFYDGPDICQDFGCSRFYYASLMLNCFFNCEYCYLQGKYPSGDLVVFVNLDDFSNELAFLLEKNIGEKIFIAASYDTDLLAFQNFFTYLDSIYSHLYKIESNKMIKNNFIFEVRTKSAIPDFFQNHSPLSSLVFAFSIAPQEIISRYEMKTPSLNARLSAIRAAQEAGHNVRICFDPVFIEKGISGIYEPFFDHVFTEINPDKLLDVSHGFFRMNKEFFQKISKRREDSSLFLQEFPSADIISYEREKRKEISAAHINIISKYIDADKIYTLE